MTLSTWILYGLMSLIPILGWVWLFQRQHAAKRSYVVLTFLAGCLAVIPIKLYEKYWDTAVMAFEHINLFQYISELVHFPSFPRLVSFILVSAIVAFLLYVVSAILMGILEIFSGDNTPKVYRQKAAKAFESPLFFISVGVLCGVVAFLLSTTLHQKIWFFVVVGMLEEFVKHLILRFSDDEKIHSVDDALSFSIIVALGFAFIENILYLHNFTEVMGSGFSNLSLFFFLRSTVSVIAHVCFSAILGYFYGIARFANQIYRQEAQENKHPCLCWMHRCLHLKSETVFHEEKLMEGMIIAMALHAIFNSLLEFGKVGLLVPFLLGMLFVVLNLFHRKELYFTPNTSWKGSQSHLVHS